MHACGRAVRMALAAALSLSAAQALARDENRSSPFNGQWIRSVAAQWDPSKPRGLKQEAPLTPEYQAIYEANLAEQDSGGQKFNPQIKCIPAGMPRMMIAYEPMEVIVTHDVTYVWVEQMSELRRIYTDGRSWPATTPPAYTGYSIGNWLDEDGDGKPDALVVETRNMKGPRTFDANGIPLAADNKTIVRERLFLDRANPDTLHDEVTTIDSALTRPWTVRRSYKRSHRVVWPQNLCAEDNHHAEIGKESYFVSDGGYLMPTRKDQPPPDLRLFGPAAK